MQQSGIFLKQNPGEAHLTIELCEMSADKNSAVFMSKISRYIGIISGSNVCCNKVREELKAIIKCLGHQPLSLHFHQLICTGLSYILYWELIQPILAVT